MNRQNAAMPQGPVRMCVICKRRFAKKELERYVRNACGKLEPDERQTASGRGWYRCASPQCQAAFGHWKPNQSGRKKGGVIGR